ncbi:MAG: hypothetical protein OXC30_03945, partial [Alphaproteobacteria bacterium]|nr:hypothetical protein [Alphaproteobacteria bacterium]
LLKTEDTRLDSLEKVVWSEEDSALDHFKKASASERSKIVKSKMRLLLSQSSAARSPEGEANQYLRVKEVLKSLSAFFRYLYPRLSADSFTNAEQPWILVQTEKEFKPLSQDELDRAENMEKSFLCVNKIYKFQHKLPGEDELSMILGIAVMPVSEYCEKRRRSELLLERLEAKIKKCAKPGESGMLKKEMNLLLQIGILFPHFEEKKKKAVKAWKARMSAFTSAKVREGLVERGDLRRLMETMDIITKQRRAQCNAYMEKILSNVKPLGNKSEREAQFRVMRGAIDGMIGFFAHLYDCLDDRLHVVSYDYFWDHKKGNYFEAFQDGFAKENLLLVNKICKGKCGNDLDCLLDLSVMSWKDFDEKNKQCSELFDEWQTQINKCYAPRQQIMIRVFLRLGIVFSYCVEDKECAAQEWEVRVKRQKSWEVTRVSDSIAKKCSDDMNDMLTSLGDPCLDQQKCVALLRKFDCVKKQLAAYNITSHGIVAQAQKVSKAISQKSKTDKTFRDAMQKEKKSASAIAANGAAVKPNAAANSVAEDSGFDSVVATLKKPANTVGHYDRPKPNAAANSVAEDSGFDSVVATLKKPANTVGHYDRPKPKGHYDRPKPKGHYDIPKPQIPAHTASGFSAVASEPQMSASFQGWDPSLESYESDLSEAEITYDVVETDKAAERENIYETLETGAEIQEGCKKSMDSLRAQASPQIACRAKEQQVVLKAFQDLMRWVRHWYGISDNDLVEIIRVPGKWEKKDNDFRPIQSKKTHDSHSALRVFMLYKVKEGKRIMLDVVEMPSEDYCQAEYDFEELLRKFVPKIKHLYYEGVSTAQKDCSPPMFSMFACVMGNSPAKRLSKGEFVTQELRHYLQIGAMLPFVQKDKQAAKAWPERLLLHGISLKASHREMISLKGSLLDYETQKSKTLAPNYWEDSRPISLKGSLPSRATQKSKTLAPDYWAASSDA